MWQARASPCCHLLLDEPTASLDIAHQFDALALVRRETAAGRGALVVLHDLNMAAAFADTLVAVSRGRIVASGRPAEVLHREALRDWFGIEATVTTDAEGGPPLVAFRGRA